MSPTELKLPNFYIVSRRGRTACGTNAVEAMNTAELQVDENCTRATVYQEGSHVPVACYEWDHQGFRVIETTAGSQGEPHEDDPRGSVGIFEGMDDFGSDYDDDDFGPDRMDGLVDTYDDRIYPYADDGEPIDHDDFEDLYY